MSELMRKIGSLVRANWFVRCLLGMMGGYLFCVLLNYFYFDGKGAALFAMQLYGLCFATLFICVCAAVPYMGVIVYFVVCFVASVLSYAYSHFGYVLSDELIYATCETTSEELGGLVTSHFVLCMVWKLLVLMLLFYALRYVFGINRRMCGMRRCLMLAGTSVALLVCYSLPSVVFFRIPWPDAEIPGKIVRCLSPQNYRWHPFFSFPGQRPPFEYFMENYRLPVSDLKKLVLGIREYHTDIELVDTAGFASELTRDDDLVCVLAIGESTRADHFGLNGYARNTTPRLSAMPGICNFSNMYSYGGSTEFSFRSIFTGLTQENEQVSRMSFVPILRKHGFRCCYYSENTADMTRSRMGDLTIGKYLDDRAAINGSIDSVVKQIRERICSVDSPRQFVVVQNGTGHYPYAHDKKYTCYHPSQRMEEGDDAARTGLLNDYDNCIVAIDAFLAGIIEGLRDKNAVLLYTADHGELLGEDDKWNHGDSGNPYLRHVAAFIWFSDAYREKYPELVSQIENCKDKPLIHGQFFATILRLCGVQSNVPLNVGDFVDDDIRNHANNLPCEILKGLGTLAEVQE